MTDNQTCYVCETACRPGAGITDNGGRRHIVCPSPEKIARMRSSVSRINAGRRRESRTQANGTGAEVHNDDSER